MKVQNVLKYSLLILHRYAKLFCCVVEANELFKNRLFCKQISCGERNGIPCCQIAESSKIWGLKEAGKNYFWGGSW